MSANDSHGTGVKRRSVIKATGTGLLGASLAGCTGTQDESTPTPGNGGSSTTSQASDGNSFSGVTVNFADDGYIDVGRFAAQTLELWTTQWEAQTGGKVNLTQPGEEGMAEAFQNNEQPHMMTGGGGDLATYLPEDLIRPYSEFQDTFPDYLDGGLHENLVDCVEFVFDGWDDQYFLMLTVKPYAPIIGNMNYFEETPGLSPDDFPPKDYDDLVRIATLLQEEGPAEVGYQPYGCAGDLIDVEYNQWAGANATGDPGTAYHYGDDWSTIEWTNDTWTEWMTKKVELYTEHGLGTPATPTMCDEPAIGMMINGQAGMVHQASSANTIFNQRAASMFEDGTLKWGTTWGGEKNFRANALIDGASFPRKPEGKDEATWNKASNAAEDLIKFLLGSDFIRDDFVTGMGFCPAWQEDWDNIPENSVTTQGGWLDAVKPMLDEADTALGYQAHPFHSEHTSNVLPQEVQKAFKGEISTQKALENAAQTAQEQLDNASGSWKN